MYPHHPTLPLGSAGVPGGQKQQLSHIGTPDHEQGQPEQREGAQNVAGEPPSCTILTMGGRGRKRASVSSGVAGSYLILPEFGKGQITPP